MAPFNENRFILYLKYTVISIAVMFLLFVTFDNLIMPMYVHSGDEIDLPDVAGKSRTQAILELRRLGVKVDASQQKYDPFHSEGTVLLQNPIPGTLVKRGRIVELTVSLGEQKVKVPDLRGLSSRDAELQLAQFNLQKGNEYYNYSDEFPEGIVISQALESGMEIAKNTVIDLTISLGLESKEFAMPKIQFKTLETASTILRQNRLRIWGIIFNVNDEYLPNTVLLQEPQPGFIVSPGDSVILIVSKMDSSRQEF